MTKSNPIKILLAASFLGFGITQAAAQANLATNSDGDANIQSADPSGNGEFGSHWTRPECLQPNMRARTHHKVVWVRKPQCHD